MSKYKIGQRLIRKKTKKVYIITDKTAVRVILVNLEEFNDSKVTCRHRLTYETVDEDYEIIANKTDLQKSFKAYFDEKNL